eukprot:1737070-Pyramimonas_sp.AAC.1
MYDVHGTLRSVTRRISFGLREAKQARPGLDRATYNGVLLDGGLKVALLVQLVPRDAALVRLAASLFECHLRSRTLLQTPAGIRR